jgi:hypothetical protein
MRFTAAFLGFFVCLAGVPQAPAVQETVVKVKKKKGDVLTPGSVDTPKIVPGDNLPIPPSFTGIYTLQALMDFDCLDGVAFDPSQGVLSLFGHQNRKDRLYRIAYLDHLATAMECESPTIDLRWAPGSEREVDRALNIDDKVLIDRLGTLYDGQGRLLPMGAWWFRLGGADVKEGMTRYKVNAAALKATGRDNDATALLILEKVEEALGKNDLDTATSFRKLLFKYIGIHDKAEELYRQSEQGTITEAQFLDRTCAMYVGAIAPVFGQDAKTYEDMYWSNRQRGVEPERAVENAVAVIVSPENQKPWLRQIIFKDLFRNLSEVHVPPASAHQILGVVPRVSVNFSNLPPRSLMARVAFEADVFGKLLMVMPDLKKKIPRYRTYFEWRRATGGASSDNEGHLWFSPDGFELNESADGALLQFGRTPVRINLHKKVSGKSVEDPVLQQYADELTGLYDDIADEYPILHELRECMKMVAVADWLKKHQVHLSLPREGRVLWNPPLEIPGIVQIVIAAKEGPVGMMLWALGGVDFDGRGRNRGALPGWKFNRSAELAVKLPREDMVVSPIEKDDHQLREIMKKTTHIEVPPPGTPMVGDPAWCGRVAADRKNGEGGKSEVGAKDRGRVLSYMTLRMNSVNQRMDLAEIEKQRDKVLQKAKWIEHCDKMINARKKGQAESVQDLEKLNREYNQKFREIYHEFYDLLSDATIEANGERVKLKGPGTSFPNEKPTGGAAFAEKRNLQGHIQDLDQVKGFLGDMTDAMDAWRTHDDGPEYRLKVEEKAARLSVELGHFAWDVKDFWRFAEHEHIAGRMAAGIKLGFTLVKVTLKAAEIKEIRDRHQEVLESLDPAAKGKQTLEKSCKERVDDFEREFRKLKELVEGK